MERLLLVRYGEIHLKGLNRPFFKRMLKQRLIETLKGLNCYVYELHGRVFVSGFAPEHEEEVIRRCANTFGVVGVCPAQKVDKTLAAMGQAAVEELTAAMAQRGLSHCTFKIKARREDKSFVPNSEGIGREVGHLVLEAMDNVTVDVHNPDILVQVEVRDGAYVYANIIPAVGGMPVGSSGKAALMLSGGIDSPVAGWMMAKRGMTLCAVHFMSPPHTGEAAKQKVLDLAQAMAVYCGPIQLHMVRFTELQEAIYEHCKHELLTVIMRRGMLRVTQALARKYNAKAIVTGESLGQVASQTVEAICATDAVAQMPVFRPLIGMDKVEIVDIAQRIGTFDISIRPGEDCCTVFVPKHPATRPVVAQIEREEQNIDMDALVQQCVEQTETLVIHPA